MKNKKGFTLVELLAVIVVLAIIMVIATQQIGNVIKKNTASSFESSLEVVAKQAKSAFILEGNDITEDDIKSLVGYNKNEYEISLESSAGNSIKDEVCLTATEDGKFGSLTKKDVPSSKNENGLVKICKRFRNDNVVTKDDEENMSLEEKFVNKYKEILNEIKSRIAKDDHEDNILCYGDEDDSCGNIYDYSKDDYFMEVLEGSDINDKYSDYYFLQFQGFVQGDFKDIQIDDILEKYPETNPAVNDGSNVMYVLIHKETGELAKFDIN